MFMIVWMEGYNKNHNAQIETGYSVVQYYAHVWICKYNKKYPIITDYPHATLCYICYVQLSWIIR